MNEMLASYTHFLPLLSTLIFLFSILQAMLVKSLIKNGVVQKLWDKGIFAVDTIV